MSDAAPKISLNQQVEEILGTLQTTRRDGAELVRKGKLRQNELDYRLRRQDAIWKSLRWFLEHEVELKAFMALAAEDRAFVLSHGALVIDLARQLAAKEAIAKAGGPVSMSAALKRLQILRRERKLDDADYRALLVRVTGQETSRGLSDDQLRRVIDAIAGGDARKAADGAVPAKIRALVWDLYHLGEWPGHPTERAIGAFVLRQAGVDDLRWLTPERVSSVVEALRAMLARAGLKLPAGVQPDRAELMLLAAQAKRLASLDAPGDVVAQLLAAVENNRLDVPSRRRMIGDAGARIRALKGASEIGGTA